MAACVLCPEGCNHCFVLKAFVGSESPLSHCPCLSVLSREQSVPTPLRKGKHTAVTHFLTVWLSGIPCFPLMAHFCVGLSRYRVFLTWSPSAISQMPKFWALALVLFIITFIWIFPCDVDFQFSNINNTGDQMWFLFMLHPAICSELQGEIWSK